VINDARILRGWKEIAGALGVSQSTARRWAHEFKLPTYKVGGQVRIKCDDLAKWEEAFREKSA
jgi:excisionase family DNA binding protein